MADRKKAIAFVFMVLSRYSSQIVPLVCGTSFDYYVCCTSYSASSASLDADFFSRAREYYVMRQYEQGKRLEISTDLWMCVILVL